MTNTPCGRPAPRYGVTITVFVYSESNSTRYAPGLYGPSSWVDVMIGTMRPYGDVGAVVVPEPHVQPEQVPVVVEPDPDVMQLGALVRAGDEVLAAVLDELHRLAAAAAPPTARAPPPATDA